MTLKCVSCVIFGLRMWGHKYFVLINETLMLNVAGIVYVGKEPRLVAILFYLIFCTFSLVLAKGMYEQS